MEASTARIFNDLFLRYSALIPCGKQIETAFDTLRECYAGGGKVLVCGNGGSAADSEHIVGELMKSFIIKRPIEILEADRIAYHFPEEGRYLSEKLQRALPAISLVSQTALATAFSNDVAADMVFAQQVYGYGKDTDVLIGLSTSGNSENVVNAIKVAKSFGLKTIGMTGNLPGMLDDVCDVVIKVPGHETYKVQEYHLPIYHALCAMLESEFFQ